MLVIPLQAVPAQTINTTLAQQSVTITMRQIAAGMLVDLVSNGTPIITGKLALDRVRLVRRPYRGFVGDLAVIDTQGTSTPDYSGLGDRWQLVYLEESDL